MTSTYQSFSPNCQVFVPTGMAQPQQNAYVSPHANSCMNQQYPAMRLENFGDYSNLAMQT